MAHIHKHFAAGLLAVSLLAACSRPAPTTPPVAGAPPAEQPGAAQPSWLAQDAAHRALKLDSNHPGAWYNEGMAYLEQMKLDDAQKSLAQSAKLQPDRYEPHLALARVYVARGDAAQARVHLAEAERLAPAAPDVAAIKPAIEAIATVTLPDGLEKRCAQLKEAALCLYQIPNSYEYDLYYLPTEVGQKAQRIAMGPMNHPDGSVDRAQLPGGVSGYWLKDNDYVLGMSRWHLLAVKDGRLFRVDAFRGFNLPPQIQGDTIRSSAFTADRKGIIDSVWKLSADLTTATLVSATPGSFK